MDAPQHHSTAGPTIGTRHHRFVIAAFTVFTDFVAACGGGLGEAERNFNAGVEHQDAGRWEVALAAYDAAIDLDPNFAAAYVSRSSVNLSLGRRNEAIGDATAAIELDPDDVNLLAEAFLARSAALANRPEQALADDEAAIALAPTDVNILARAYINRSQDNFALGRLSEATDDATAAIELDPDNVNLLALAFTVRSDALNDHPEKALADDEAAIALEPTDDNILAYAHFSRFYHLDLLGRYSEALRALAAACDLGYEYRNC